MSRRGTGEARPEALYVAYFGAAEAALGNASDAGTAFDRAVAAFSDLDDRPNLAVVDVLRGLVDAHSGAREKAMARIERAERAVEGGLSAAASHEDVRFAIRMVRAALDRK